MDNWIQPIASKRVYGLTLSIILAKRKRSDEAKGKEKDVPVSSPVTLVHQQGDKITTRSEGDQFTTELRKIAKLTTHFKEPSISTHTLVVPKDFLDPRMKMWPEAEGLLFPAAERRFKNQSLPNIMMEGKKLMIQVFAARP